MAQVIRTVLEVDGSRAAAGFATAGKAAAGYGRALSVAGAAERTAGASMGRLSGSIRDNRAEWDSLSSTAMVGGAAIAGGLGLATKAAISWESSWAGVSKTVDGTPKQMAELEEGLRGLAKELPATHEELAGVAEAAGQLGVAREDILGFTETAVALGESTNLSAEEAATSLAKFSNIMGTTAREGVAGYEKLGSTLVALGNDGASTEADIMSMSLRLAGAGKQIGATESDILAMANALTSVGIEAELGGGAMSRAMLEMNSAVISGNGQLEDFAKTAGMSASEFATAWRKDPIAATNAFVTGLGRIGESGGDAAAVLQQVGLGGTQNAQVLLRAAGASDLLSDSLALGKTAWNENSALAEEAGKRYATTESQLKVARNQIKDAAIDIGGAFAPIAVKGAEAVAGIANAFGSLPGPVKGAVSGIAGVTSGVLLLGGATVKAVGWTQDMTKRLDDLGMLTPRVEKGLKGAAAGAKLFGQAMAVTAAVGTVGSLLQDKGDSVGVQQLTKDLLEADDAVGVFNDSMSSNAADMGTIQGDITSFGDALQVAFDPGFFDKFSAGGDSVFKTLSFGMADMQTTTDESTKAFTELDGVLTGLVSQGRGDLAAQMFVQFEEKARAAGVSTDELKSKLPGYSEALAAAGNQAKLTGDDTAGMGTDMETAEKAAADLSDAIKSLGDTLLQQEASQDGYEASLDAVTASIKENGNTLDANTEAGRANRAALRDLATSTQEWAAATLEAGGSTEQVEGILDRGRAKWIANRDAIGANKTETRALADELFKIDGLEPTAKVDAQTEAATKKTRDFTDLVTGVSRTKGVATVTETGAAPAAARVMELRDKIFGVKGKSVTVTESGATPARSRVMGLNERIVGLNGKTVTVKEEGASPSTARLGAMKQGIANIDGKTVTVTEVGSTAAGGRVVSFKNKIYEVPPSRSSDVRANVHGKWDVDGLLNSIGAVQSKTVTITSFVNRINRVFGDSGLMLDQGPSGLTQSFADGGFPSIGAQQPQIRAAGGLGITWAEEGAGPWEGFVSGHPAKKGRSRAITGELAHRLGGEVVWDNITKMAAGGIRSYKLGQISDRRWEELIAQGWRGRAGDRQERIYAPAGWGQPKPMAAPKRVAAPKQVAAPRRAAVATPKPTAKSWAGTAFQRSTPSPHAGRTYVRPQPAASQQSSSRSSGNGTTIAYLHASDRALLTRVADRPVRLDVDGRTLGITLQRNAANRKGRG